MTWKDFTQCFGKELDSNGAVTWNELLKEHGIKRECKVCGCMDVDIYVSGVYGKATLFCRNKACLTGYHLDIPNLPTRPDLFLTEDMINKAFNKRWRYEQRGFF
jgi:hypothetical protein